MLQFYLDRIHKDDAHTRALWFSLVRVYEIYNDVYQDWAQQQGPVARDLLDSMTLLMPLFTMLSTRRPGPTRAAIVRDYMNKNGMCLSRMCRPVRTHKLALDQRRRARGAQRKEVATTWVAVISALARETTMRTAHL